MSCPSTRVRTVTVLRGVTEPRPLMYKLKPVFFVSCAITGTMGTAEPCPFLAEGDWPRETKRYAPMAIKQTTNSRIPQRLRDRGGGGFDTESFFASGVNVIVLASHKKFLVSSSAHACLNDLLLCCQCIVSATGTWDWCLSSGLCFSKVFNYIDGTQG